MHLIREKYYQETVGVWPILDQETSFETVSKETRSKKKTPEKAQCTSQLHEHFEGVFFFEIDLR